MQRTVESARANLIARRKFLSRNEGAMFESKFAA